MTTQTAPAPRSPRAARAVAYARRWWGELATTTRIAIALAIAVNAALLAGYVWSRPGQTTHVRVVVQDKEFSAYVDGRLATHATFDAPEQGGLILTLEDAKGVPSVPHPNGLDSLRVHDLDTGDLLYSDEFSNPPPTSAVVHAENQARLGIDRGVLEVQTPGGAVFSNVSFRVDGAAWHNYTVDLTYRNIIHASVRVRAPDANSGVEYELRPFRHLVNRLSLYSGGKEVSSVSGSPIEAQPSEVVRSMVAQVLRPYPYAALVLLAAFLLVAVLQFVPDISTRVTLSSELRAALEVLPWLVIGGLAATAFGVLLHYNYSIGAHMPHVPDELSYLFQAKVLAAGHLTVPAPPVKDSFQLGNPPLTVISDANWVSIYPFGHPLMLAIGERIGAVWLIPPIVGAASIVLLFAIGRKLYGVRVGLLAAVLFAASPFFLMTASNFMSHNTAAFYLLASILFLAYADRRPLLFPFLSGIFLGLVFNTRQLTGASLVIPYGLLMITFVLPADRRRIGLKQVGAFAAGGAIMLLAYFAYRTGTLGSPLASDGIQSGKDQFGFAGSHSVSVGVEHEQTQLTFFVMMISNWPVTIGLMFALIPFAFGTRNRWDWFLLVATAFMMGVYTLYFIDGFMHGPRFWYETTPLLLLLTARGADIAASAVAAAAAHARSWASEAHAPPLWLARGIVFAFVLALTYVGWHDWALGDGAQWSTDFAPSSADELRGFNFMNDALVKQVEAADLHNALVLTEECPGWWCYGNLDWLNSPRLDGDVVYARDLPKSNAELFKAFPDRVVYQARYEGTPLLVPYTGHELTPSDTSPPPEATPPVASSLPTPVPVVPTPPNPADAIGRDERRKTDLEALATALDQYHAAHANYPVSGSLQSICTYPNDAGCALKEVLGPLPSEPTGGATYWYRSADGAHFTLFAHMEGAAPPSECPPVASKDERPQVENLYCLTK